MNVLAAPSYLAGLFGYGPYALALQPKVVIMPVVTVSQSLWRRRRHSPLLQLAQSLR